MKSVIVIDQKTFKNFNNHNYLLPNQEAQYQQHSQLTLQEIRLHDYIIFIHVSDSSFIYFVKLLFNCSLT